MFNYCTAFCSHKNALKQRQEQSDLAQDHNSLLFKIFLLFKLPPVTKTEITILQYNLEKNLCFKFIDFFVSLLCLTKYMKMFRTIYFTLKIRIMVIM